MTDKNQPPSQIIMNRGLRQTSFPVQILLWLLNIQQCKELLLAPQDRVLHFPLNAFSAKPSYVTAMSSLKTVTPFLRKEFGTLWKVKRLR